MSKMTIKIVILRKAASNHPWKESSMAKLRRKSVEAKVQKAKEQKVRFITASLTVFYRQTIFTVDSDCKISQS